MASLMTYGLSEVTLVLSPENVEIVGRSSRVNDLHVAVLVLPLQLFRRGVNPGLIVAELEESLDTTRRVLGTLTVVTVRQGENQTSSLEPFSLTRSNELVNDTLGIVAVDCQRTSGRS